MRPTSAVSWFLILARSVRVRPLSAPAACRPPLLPILYDSSNALHRSIEYHPEQPNRISVCIDALRRREQEAGGAGCAGFDLVDMVSVGGEELSAARAALTKVHSDEYVARFEEKCGRSREARIAEGRPPLGFVGNIDEDTYLTTESFGVFMRAATSWTGAVDAAMTDGGAALALVRPPGHHATRTLANGFCVFNFAAASAVHALAAGGRRVSILDWDVHYGQGTAKIVGEMEGVRYTSLHQVPAFPYEGEDPGVSGSHNNLLSVPVQAGTTWESGYSDAYENVALPFLSSAGEWVPDVVIVSAGYDGLESDELASVSLAPADYGTMVRKLHEHLEREHDGSVPPVVLGLEGGYQLRTDDGRGLDAAVMETVASLVDCFVG